MKKKVIIILILLVITNVNIILASEINVSAKSAIVIEQETGRILYNKNIDEKMPMASTTKILTALLAIENGKFNDTVIIDKNATLIEGSSIYLKQNEEIKLEDLLFGLMLRSGNDAAYSIAKHIGGSYDSFIDLMNFKAKSIGAYNTNFINPHGLHDDNHYTTAYDLAIITQYAFRNEKFIEIVSTKSKNYIRDGEQHTFLNKNKFLNFYEGGNGVKTGYTTVAGKCLVFSAKRDNMQLIGVVLDSNNIWEDSKNLMDNCFSNYSLYNIVSKGEYIQTIKVVGGDDDLLRIRNNKDIYIPLKDDEIEDIKIVTEIPKSIDTPISKYQEVGKLKVFLKEELIYDKSIFCPNRFNTFDLLNEFTNMLKDFYDFNFVNSLIK